MDPVLTSLLHTNQVGSDGFLWWIGQVESDKGEDEKNGGRYRVRIVGTHLKECDITPSDQLPWAQTMMPVTAPYSDGGTTGASANLKPGNWVMGFYLDPVEKQKPIIMGSIAHTPASTIIKNEDPTPGESGCKSFTTFVRPDTKPQTDLSANQQGGTNEDGANTTGGENAATNSDKENEAPPALYSARLEHSETVPNGTKTCVTVANPKCGTESNFSKQLTNIVGDLLNTNQKVGGSIGSHYVSKVNGFMYDKIGIARYHIGRVTRLVRSLMGRAQSEMIKKIREGIEWIVKTVIATNVPEEQKGKVPKDPKADHDTTRPKGNILKRVKKILDKVLEALGCAIEDATDRLVAWLTKLLFNFLMDVFSPAMCFITNLVEGIISQIMGIIDGLISKVLGPIQSILSIIGGSMDIVGGMIAKVMSFLGITCSGPDGNCRKNSKKCSDGDEDTKEPDWLDKLLDDIESGDTGERFDSVCDESKDYLDDRITNVIFVGGVPTWPTPTIPTTGSKPPGSIGDTETPDSFFPPGATDPSTDPNVVPTYEVDDDDSIFDEVEDTVDTEIENGTSGIDDATEDDDGLPDIPISVDGTKHYSVTAYPDFVYNGESITYSVITSNVPGDTELEYTISGDTIEDSYIDTSDETPLTGTFKVVQTQVVTDQAVDDDGNFNDVEIPIGITPVSIKLTDDVQTLMSQTLTFTVQSTTSGVTTDHASTDVTIAGDLDNIIYEDGVPAGANTLSLYTVEADKTHYNEGEDIVFTITTTNVEDGTKGEYLIYGDVTSDDLIQDSMTGNFVVRNNSAVVTVGLQEDLEDEFDESLYFKIVGRDAATSVTIIGTYEPPTSPESSTPELDQPVAGTPITDDMGSIVSIPISDTGSSYEEAPYVIISGKGYGATGIALLDPSGYVSEIRVTRGGLGYKKNLPSDSNVRCIVDSFTLISPGIHYTSAPDVYIDGDPDVAEAIIDDRGYVISVRILDRTKIYEHTPKVIIIGGGGMGAAAMPSMVCLSEDDLERAKYVKVGTGRYIDCP